MLRLIDAKLKRLDLGDRLVRRNPLYYGSTQRQLEALQASSLVERVSWTQERLARVLKAAAATRYGKRCGAPSELARWPLLSKDSVRNDPGAFRASGSWFSTHASTGGTTGTPLSLVRSPSAIVAEQVCLDLMMQKLGAEAATARIAVLRADSVKDAADDRPPYWVYSVGGQRLLLSSAHLSARTLPQYIAELTAFKPDVLWVHPTMLEVLCRLLADSQQVLRIPRVLASSEMLLPEVWRLAQRLLNCEIVDYYGQAERVAFAYACQPGQYFFLPGYAAVELLPRDVDEQGASYEIVGTSVWNLAMPLVRYRTGDLIRTPKACSDRELQEIVHGVRSFEGIVGRSQDVLLAPDGCSVVPGLSHIVKDVPHLLRLQIVQESTTFVRLRVLPAPGFSRSDAERLMRNARSKIPEPAKIEIEVADALARTARGKTPFVMHSPDVQQAMRTAGLHAAPR